jgi:putative transcriptional regulator
MPEAKILAGMRDAVAYARSEKVEVRKTVIKTPPEVDVKQVREGLKMTQQEFASQFGFSIGALKNWEQGHRRPNGPARVLLTVIAKDPEAVMAALSDTAN